jgi:hypothetical protein
MVPVEDPFEIHRSGLSRFLVRTDAVDEILPLLRSWAAGQLPPPRPLLGGRGGVGLYDVGSPRSVVLRPCRRGGLVARLNRDVYFGLRPRPFREIRRTEVLRRRGVPTVEMLGAGVRWLAPAAYRAVVGSVYAVGAVNLWEYLRAAVAAERVRVCQLVADATRVLHDAGGVHPDLNLQNFLVRRRQGEREVLIIDCDRVVLRRVEDRDRGAAFARICRSIRKLDPDSAVLSFECVEALRRIGEPD